MSSEQPEETGGRTSVASASGRPLSSNPDAVRKREARKGASSRTSTSAGSRGGPEAPATKGNPLRPSDWSTMGEPLSPHEAERQLYWAHKGLARALRSDVDLDEMKEEFEVAGENYSFVANKMFPALRVMIRFVAPLVLAAVLISIWVAIVVATPWWQRLTQWWVHRGEEQPQAPPVYQDQAPANGQAHVSVVRDEEQPQAPPPVPRRPAIVRRFSR